MRPAFILLFILIAPMTQADTQITIYSGNHQGSLSTNQLQNARNIPGFAVVNEQRMAEFKKGRFSLSIDDVAEHIDPTTVTLKLADNPADIEVLDQNFQFDLVSTDKLLQKYLDQTITVNHDRGSDSINTSGTLLSTQGGLTLRSTDGTISTLKNWNEINFPELPGGLLTKPTLVWLIDSKTTGSEQLKLSYQTSGMTWWVDYNILLSGSGDQCQMDLTSWVTLVNKSGASYADAGLKLIAGDVNRVTQQQPRAAIRKEAMSMAADNQFSEESLFEYHLYQLPRAVDLPNNSTKQIPFLPDTYGISCEQILEYNGSQMRHINYHRPINDRNYLRQGNTKVDAFLTFTNSQNNQLGMPMPAGRVRVNMLDSSGDNPQFIGEDHIDHTADNATVTLQLGQSFDVTGSRVQTDFQSHKNSLTERFRITLDNQKKHPQKVRVTEPLYRWSDWTVTEASEQYEKVDASTIQFVVEVPAKSNKTITYEVRYSWAPTGQ
jgi:hypothetical protein